ncbi:PREDICTED: sodium/potassium-transporting ATPase subunit beta-2 isoform X2 [Drosophila arizonae]|uniref:Sodium/potassium-transporting ATPase subunit beta-2 isoform X2 n=1 Tax=Drosophila arizonae TaxID=7263 RepID=A0ABM1NVC4_DROAR|nr:PREDICTED: sodium/potassium-transporting ATPase subunit beta-2 isoform X2 [Drosophila arizonae]
MSKPVPMPHSETLDEMQHLRKPEPFNFAKFLYNTENGTVMGRDRASWAKIGIFYIIFYGVLGALVAICMWAFFLTLDPRIPKWKLESSIIGTNPGLGFRPLPPVDNVESTLIWYKGTQYENYKHWTDSLDEFLEVYKVPGLTPGRGQNIYNCDYNQPPPRGQVCDVDIKSWAPCTKENNYSYHKSSPCIFLKLNKIYDWRPDFYNNSQTLPADMPSSLKNHISELEKTDPIKLNKIFGWMPEVYESPINEMPSNLVNVINNTAAEERQQIWVSCNGHLGKDKENFQNISYYPRQGFPIYYYPYLNQPGYLSPIVAVQIKSPPLGTMLDVECRAWAKNIIYSGSLRDRMGSVTFQLLID